jgi:hypothetical protein
MDSLPNNVSLWGSLNEFPTTHVQSIDVNLLQHLPSNQFSPIRVVVVHKVFNHVVVLKHYKANTGILRIFLIFFIPDLLLYLSDLLYIVLVRVFLVAHTTKPLPTFVPPYRLSLLIFIGVHLIESSNCLKLVHVLF